ncbi:serine/threonine-protein kinase HipA [Hamadaea flava]|uniref:Type II toxin-antitoxin system HipA family toxin n=1 Tax=Hamadaea flava TaxID=1742688 RepID=A0ABV8LJH7_9ACTN|nr:type II toxin-antitoxin system HipA family toxin [Hamadaea flava]MCP2324874.1 serine/threonine-protein kinase HipA [Hamadaea flava]
MVSELVVVMRGRRVGELKQDDRGRLALRYDSEWRAAEDSTPLSLSMPLSEAEHEDQVVRAFLWGLLPDNEAVLERWAQVYQVSARNPFALLRHVGEDCAGAAQFVTPERIEAIMAGDGGVEWIDVQEIAARVRTLRSDPAAWNLSRSGQFSLAGAQAKTALHYDEAADRWGDPWGVVPTTHIVKPAISGFDEHDLNEHLCLEAARGLGIVAARSRVVAFGAERVIVVERYDRQRSAVGAWLRVHQEDVCQALGRPPTAKYQNEGGPGPEDVIGLLRRAVLTPRGADADVQRFVDALVFNWLIGGTDAHAKNYSILLGGAGARLAPLYDVASALPYDDMYMPRLRMAMRIGGDYRLDGITGTRWRRLAVEAGLDPAGTVDRARAYAQELPDVISRIAKGHEIAGLASGLPGRLAERMTARATLCERLLDR